MSYGLTIPALRGRQGGRTFYQCMVPNAVLNNFFPINLEPDADRSQREIDPVHAREIAEYMIDNSNGYLLGAITYAVDDEGTFTPAGNHADIGSLTIPMTASLRSLDGQHRRQAIKEAIDIDPSFQNDSTSILIYVESELDARRQMFSDMNATPKVVAKALNISFDARDPYARAANALADEHPLLRGHTEKQAARVKAASVDYFSLAGVYDAIKRLDLGLTLPRGRSPHREVDQLIALGTEFFDLLQNARPEFAEAANLSPSEMRDFRAKTILFSTTTLRAIAGAVHGASKHADVRDLSRFTEGLRALDFRPESQQFQEMFVDSGFVSPGKGTPNARNQEVLAGTEAIRKALLARL